LHAYSEPNAPGCRDAQARGDHAPHVGLWEPVRGEGEASSRIASVRFGSTRTTATLTPGAASPPCPLQTLFGVDGAQGDWMAKPSYLILGPAAMPDPVQKHDPGGGLAVRLEDARSSRLMSIRLRVRLRGSKNRLRSIRPPIAPGDLSEEPRSIAKQRSGESGDGFRICDRGIQDFTSWSVIRLRRAGLRRCPNSLQPDHRSAPVAHCAMRWRRRCHLLRPLRP
jgi:hypothetical protein